MSVLVDRLFAVHDALRGAGLAHAFGGAIALAYCVHEPRGTRDLDVNIFAEASDAAIALDALPDEVRIKGDDVAKVERDGQGRLWWDDTPVDVFLNNLPLHVAVSERVRWVPLEGREIPVIDCVSLAIFKAFFNRTKDWADLEAIAEAAPNELGQAAATMADLVGDGDEAVLKLKRLAH